MGPDRTRVGATAPGRPVRVLLVQLSANGDCLYVTTVARQIKHDFPGCHLTWAIAANCRRIIDNNPDVDTIWELPVPTQADIAPAIGKLMADVAARTGDDAFDHVFVTQVACVNEDRYDGTIRGAHLKGYPRPITVPVTPVLRLFDHEIEAVNAFAQANRLGDFSHVVLFECAPKSGQSRMNPDLAKRIAEAYSRAHPDTAFVLSCDRKIESDVPGVIDGSVLTPRQTVELTKHCDLLIGCTSGITWLCTSDWAKPLPMLQVMDPNATWTNSLVKDHNRFGLPVDHILETTSIDERRLFDCIDAILRRGIAEAKRQFHESMPTPLQTYVEIERNMWQRRRPLTAIRFTLRSVLSRPGLLRPRLLKEHARFAYRYFRSVMRPSTG